MHYLRPPNNPKFLAHTIGLGVSAPNPAEELLPNEVAGLFERPFICCIITGTLLVAASATRG